MGSAVVLLSGGLDSATLLHYVLKRLRIASVHTISFRYGQKHSRELDMARMQAGAAGVAEHRLIDISLLGPLCAGTSALVEGGAAVPVLSALPAAELDQPPTYVPNRNMIFLSLAAAYAEARDIPVVYYGAQAHDEYGYWDCTAQFLRGINAVLSLNRRRRVKVRAPFMAKSKAQVVRIGLKLGVDYGRTWSCYRGGERPCGTCPTCVERSKAFMQAGVPDPLAASGA